jgi:hypothetical protein
VASVFVSTALVWRTVIVSPVTGGTPGAITMQPRLNAETSDAKPQREQNVFHASWETVPIGVEIFRVSAS